MIKILEPQYKKYKEQKNKRMEKQIRSMNFSKNIDKEPLLREMSIDNKLDQKEEKKIREQFRDQMLLELQKVDFFYNQNVNRVIKPKIKELKEQIKHALKINEFKMNLCQ